MTLFSSTKGSIFRSALVLFGITFFLAVAPSPIQLSVEGAGQKQNAPAGTADLGGTITYCANVTAPPTPNVTVTAQGAATFMQTTNASGAYLFHDIPTDTYTISCSKPAFASPAGSGINTTDVTRILTHLADPPNSTLTNCQRRAADTSANGVINTTDVTNVLNFLALTPPTATNHTGEWRFCKTGTTGPPGGSCTSADVLNLLSPTLNENFDAILLGEVSGNLVPSGPTPNFASALYTTNSEASGSYSDASAPVSTTAQANRVVDPNVVTPIVVTLPTATVIAPLAAGFMEPITISDVTPAGGMQVTGYILQFSYNAAVVGVQNPVFSTAGTLSSVIPDANIVPNTATPGVIRIVAVAPAGVSLTGSGTLINIRLTRIGAPATTSPLNWDVANTEFDDGPNDGIFAKTTTNGILTMGAPTAVHLSSFKAASYDNGVYLNWKSGFETENLGYNIYREVAGKRTLVNSDIIAGSALMTGASTKLEAGQSYGWWDKSAGNQQDARYWLEEIDINGIRTMHGPFDVHTTGANPPRTSQAALLSQLGRGEPTTHQLALSYQPDRQDARSAEFSAQATASSTLSTLKLASMPAARITIREEGWYRVTQQDLAAAGLDPKADPGRLQLYLDGVEQPILVTGDTIEFFGTGQDTVSTDAHVYWLVNGDRPGKRVGLTSGQGNGGGATSFPYTVERRDRSVYFSSLRNGETENFFGQVVTSSSVDQTVAVSHLDSASGGATQVEIALQGAIDVEGQVDHQVRILLNGSDLGRITFDGLAHKVQKFAVSPGILKNGDNVFTLIGEASNRDVSLVDYIRVTYQHTYTTDQDVLRLTASGAQTIDGFSNAAIRIFDITDPASVSELAVNPGSSGDKYAVGVALPEGTRTLLALTDERIKRPASITANIPSNLKNKKNKATFVIIARREFFPTLEPLRALRENQGFRVALVDIEDIYDEFSNGERTPQAVKDFLSFATTTWKKGPRFVLFAGHASLDPNNHLGFGDSDLVPTKLIDTELMEAASDDWFADFNGDGLAELAVGRLPFRSVDEAATMVSKIVSYESSSASSEALFVADSNDGFDFEAASSQLRALMPTGLKASQINRGRVDPDTAKAQLFDAINRGQKLVNYIGHGSVNQWKGDLLTNDDALALTNGGRLPLFVMMTCLNGYFHDAALDSLGESLLKAQRGGAVAVWASSGMTSPTSQEAANHELYRLLFGQAQKLTLGEAVMRAKSAAQDSDVRRTWVLMGDPTMRVK